MPMRKLFLKELFYNYKIRNKLNTMKNIVMDRVPENELMNGEEQAKAYAFADFTEAHNFFIEKFIVKFTHLGFNSSFNDTVLDLGCGSCDITRKFAVAFPDADFHAVDGAKEMLKYAAEINGTDNLSNRIKLIETCLPDVELPQQFYNTIISNSLLHHLHDPLVLWNTILKHAKPFAYIFVMDLMRPIDEQTVKFLSKEYLINEPDILIEDFENSLRAAFTVKEVRQQLVETGLTKLNVEEVTDRHMIIYGVL